MAWFETLAKEGQRTDYSGWDNPRPEPGKFPGVVQHMRKLERFHEAFVRLNHHLCEVGFGYIALHDQSYEWFTAALLALRWDDTAGIPHKMALVQDARREMTEILGELPSEDEVNKLRGEVPQRVVAELIYAIQMAHYVAARIGTKVDEAATKHTA